MKHSVEIVEDPYTCKDGVAYSALFICVCISLLLHSHVAKYYATTAYASRENSKELTLLQIFMLCLSCSHVNCLIYNGKEQKIQH